MIKGDLEIYFYFFASLQNASITDYVQKAVVIPQKRVFRFLNQNISKTFTVKSKYFKIEVLHLLQNSIKKPMKGNFTLKLKFILSVEFAAFSDNQTR